jgi:hypothetical protein
MDVLTPAFKKINVTDAVQFGNVKRCAYTGSLNWEPQAGGSQRDFYTIVTDPHGVTTTRGSALRIPKGHCISRVTLVPDEATALRIKGGQIKTATREFALAIFSTNEAPIPGGAGNIYAPVGTYVDYSGGITGTQQLQFSLDNASIALPQYSNAPTDDASAFDSFFREFVTGHPSPLVVPGCPRVWDCAVPLLFSGPECKCTIDMASLSSLVESKTSFIGAAWVSCEDPGLSSGISNFPGASFMCQIETFAI